MANDGYTELNPGLGGDFLDESEITYGSAPTTRKRERMVIGGDGAPAELAVVTNTAPDGNDYGLVTRIAGNLPLPSGAATEATVAAAQTTLTTLATEATLATRAASSQLPSALVGGRLDVVSSPNQTSSSGTITAIGAFGIIGYGSLNATVAGANTYVEFNCSGFSTIWFTLTGTWTGFLYFEATADGTNWFTIDAQMPGVTNTVSFGAATQIPGAFRCCVAGLNKFRVRAPLLAVSAITSVTVTYSASAMDSPSTEPQAVMGTSANGGLVKNNPFVIAGSSANKAYICSVDSNGVIATQGYAEAIANGVFAGNSGRISGRIATASISEAAVRESTYIEQTSGAQRSIKSSSALDTAAGTGIRTVRIVYYTLTAGVIAGPLTEDLTMNGILGVNTVATNICYIEKMYALTVGSGLVAAGNIDLMTLIGGAGVAFARIPTGARNTRYAHHYVSSGVYCNLINFHGSSTATSANAPLFTCRYKNPANANDAEQELIDNIQAQGTQNSAAISFNPPATVLGPAVLTFYVVPSNTGAQTQSMTVGYYET